MIDFSVAELDFPIGPFITLRKLIYFFVELMYSAEVFLIFFFYVMDALFA